MKQKLKIKIYLHIIIIFFLILTIIAKDTELMFFIFAIITGMFININYYINTDSDKDI